MQRSYKAILRLAKTGGYEAAMPGRPYVSAAGSTREEAITNLRNQLARELVRSQPGYRNNPAEDNKEGRLPGVTYPPDLSDPRVQDLLNAMVTTDDAPVLSNDTKEWLANLVYGLRYRPQMFMCYHSESPSYDDVVNYLLGFECAQRHHKIEPVLDLYQGLAQQRLGGGRNICWSGKVWKAAGEDDEKALTLLFEMLEDYIEGNWLEPGSTIVQFECPID